MFICAIRLPQNSLGTSSLSSDRARNRVENSDVAQEAKFAFYFTLFGLGGATCYAVKSMRDLQRLP